MSFFKVDDNPNTIAERTTYTYPDITVRTQDIFEHTNNDKENSIKNKLPPIEGRLMSLKDRFYKVVYRNREPNFVYNGIAPSSYIANNIYLYGLLHNNISGVTSGDKKKVVAATTDDTTNVDGGAVVKNTNVVGEIVIEHTNANKQSQKIYTCFLVKERDESDKLMDNSIDKLIQKVSGQGMDPEVSIKLNNAIPSQTNCIHYEDDGNHIFVFTSPIIVNQDAARFFEEKLSLDTKLFKVHPPYSYEIINLKPSVESFSLHEGFIEGNEDEIFIDCQPTDGGDYAENILSNEIGKDYTTTESRIDTLKMVFHFSLFIIIYLVSIVVAPTFANYIYTNYADFKAALIWLLFAPFITGVLLVSTGFGSVDNMGEAGLGFIIATVLFGYNTWGSTPPADTPKGKKPIDYVIFIPWHLFWVIATLIIHFVWFTGDKLWVRWFIPFVYLVITLLFMFVKPGALENIANGLNWIKSKLRSKSSVGVDDSGDGSGDGSVDLSIDLNEEPELLPRIRVPQRKSQRKPSAGGSNNPPLQPSLDLLNSQRNVKPGRVRNMPGLGN